MTIRQTVLALVAAAIFAVIGLKPTEADPGRVEDYLANMYHFHMSCALECKNSCAKSDLHACMRKGDPEYQLRPEQVDLLKEWGIVGDGFSTFYAYRP